MTVSLSCRSVKTLHRLHVFVCVCVYLCMTVCVVVHVPVDGYVCIYLYECVYVILIYLLFILYGQHLMTFTQFSALRLNILNLSFFLLHLLFSCLHFTHIDLYIIAQISESLNKYYSMWESRNRCAMLLNTSQRILLATWTVHASDNHSTISSLSDTNHPSNFEK